MEWINYGNVETKARNKNWNWNVADVDYDGLSDDDCDSFFFAIVMIVIVTIYKSGRQLEEGKRGRSWLQSFRITLAIVQ